MKKKIYIFLKKIGAWIVYQECNEESQDVNVGREMERKN